MGCCPDAGAPEAFLIGTLEVADGETEKREFVGIQIIEVPTVEP